MLLSEKTVVSTEWLSSRIEDPDIILADCRYNLIDHSEGRRKYLESHIPGAYFIDMEADLTGIKKEHGGRHPIPDPEEFARKMSTMGLTEGKTVVAYDENLSGAARLWWLLKYFGYHDVYVLDGGIKKWVAEGKKTTTELPKEVHGSFIPEGNNSLLVGMKDVRDRSSPRTVIDSRAPERYRGEVEPIDAKAGHIPGAANIYYMDTMEPEGTLKERNELRKLFADISGEAVVYCGSGITSCVNILALASLGIESKLYPGSWSDWISFPENKIATGNSG